MVYQQIKKRSDAIDMVKGLSIMTLFFLHFEQGLLNVDYNYFLVRSPAFYIVVGWLWGLSTNRRNVKEHWKKRFQGLVKPYIYFSLIFITFDLITVALQLREPFVLYRDIYKTICLRGIGTLWFLPALLGGEMTFLYLRTKRWYIKVLSTISVFVLLCLIWRDLFENDMYNAPIKVIKESGLAYLFISVAYFISRRWGKHILSINKTYLFAIGALLLTTCFIYTNFYKFHNFFNINIAISYIFSGSIAGLGILFLFTSIENFKILSKPLVYCGKNSLTIMSIHWGLLFELTRIIDKHVFAYENYYGERTIVYFLIAVVLQILIIEFINKKVPFIIGK